MVQARIHRENKSEIYFITPTIIGWYYVFDRHNRWQILADSLTYLQKNRGLEIHAYVFMLNHLHLIFQAPDAPAILRDFKRHTTKQLKANLTAFEPRLLDLFTDSNDVFKFWKTDNQPKILVTEKIYLQKLNYIHNNPVQKSYVDHPEHWKWSSANPQSPIETVATL